MKKKFRNLINNSPMNMKHWKNNGKPKEKISLTTTLKTQSTEPPPNKPGTISLKDSTKTNPSGSKTRQKLLSLNTENSTKMSLRTPAIPSPGPISRPKVTSILLAWCTFLKEPHTTSSKNSIKKITKLNYSSEESLLMTSSKTFSPNILTLSRPSSILITCPWTLIDKTSSK